MKRVPAWSPATTILVELLLYCNRPSCLTCAGFQPTGDGAAPHLIRQGGVWSKGDDWAILSGWAGGAVSSEQCKVLWQNGRLRRCARHMLEITPQHTSTPAQSPPEVSNFEDDVECFGFRATNTLLLGSFFRKVERTTFCSAARVDGLDGGILDCRPFMRVRVSALGRLEMDT